MGCEDFIHDTLEEFGITVSFNAFAFEKGGYAAAPDELWYKGRYLGDLHVYTNFSDCGNEYAVGCIINKEPKEQFKECAYDKAEFKKIIEEAINVAN